MGEQSRRARTEQVARVDEEEVSGFAAVPLAWAVFSGGSAAGRRGTEDSSTVREPGGVGLEGSGSSEDVNAEVLSDSKP